MSIESVTALQTPANPEVKSPETALEPVGRMEQLPVKSVGQLREQTDKFFADKEAALIKINSLRGELGLPDTSELPFEIIEKQRKLKDEMNKAGEYIDFETIEKDADAALNSEKMLEEKIKLFWNEIELLPMVQVNNLRTYGTYLNGALFHSMSLGTVQPRLMKHLILFHEEHDVSAASTEMMREIKKSEQKEQDTLVEDVDSDKNIEEQKQLPANEQKLIESPQPEN